MKKTLFTFIAMLALSSAAFAKSTSSPSGPVVVDPKTGKEITGGYVIRDGQCINLRNSNPVTMTVCTQAGVK